MEEEKVSLRRWLHFRAGAHALTTSARNCLALLVMDIIMIMKISNVGHSFKFQQKNVSVLTPQQTTFIICLHV